jgi:choline/glycine/proline betaine transport protein
MFIARISRGRTVREFVAAVLFIPAGFTFFWMTVFGNTAMTIDAGVANGALGAAISQDVSVGLFRFFEYLPLSGITSTLAVLLVSIFFITSADSGALVVDSIAAGGETETTVSQRIFWCSMEGIVAACLLMAGGLSALQSATVASALPFTIVMLALVVSLYLGMQQDLAQREVHSHRNPVPAEPAFGQTWQRRLALMLNVATEKEVTRFVDEKVGPALDKVAAELQSRGRPTDVVREAPGLVTLRSPASDVRDFIYGVSVQKHRVANFTTIRAGEAEFRYEARTFFSSGNSGYDIMGLSPDQIIGDVLIQFERYLHLVNSPEFHLVQGAPEHTT